MLAQPLEYRLGIVVPVSEAAGVPQSGFDELYERHGREVWAVAYARRLDAGLAADIAQETFLRFWRARQAGEVIDNPRAWLLRVGRNLAEDTAKAAFRRHGTAGPDAFGGVPGLNPEPAEILARGELRALVRAVLEELPAADRDVLTLKYALDYDAATIAEMLGIQASAVHMRLSRARQRLSEKLLEHGVQGWP
jgi:RNA polymerase sigma-70 factor (ECF subfamily)